MVRLIKQKKQPVPAPGAYTSAVDFWALGVSLVQMLTRKNPFDTGNKRTAYERILSLASCERLKLNVSCAQVVPHPSVTAPAWWGLTTQTVPVTANCYAVTDGLLQKEPPERFGSGRKGMDFLQGHAWFRDAHPFGVVDWRQLAEGKVGAIGAS